MVPCEKNKLIFDCASMSFLCVLLLACSILLSSSIWCLVFASRVQHSCTGMYHPPHCCLQDTRHENGKYQLRDLFNDLIEYPSNQSNRIVLSHHYLKNSDFKIQNYERKKEERDRKSKRKVV